METFCPTTGRHLLNFLNLLRLLLDNDIALLVEFLLGLVPRVDHILDKTVYHISYTSFYSTYDLLFTLYLFDYFFFTLSGTHEFTFDRSDDLLW